MRGTECSFAHGHEQLRRQPDFFKTQLCVQFKKGLCLNQDSCRFAHGLEELKNKDQVEQPGLKFDSGMPLGQILVPARVLSNQTRPFDCLVQESRPCLLDAQHRLDPYASAALEDRHDVESDTTDCSSEVNQRLTSKTTSLTSSEVSTSFHGQVFDEPTPSGGAVQMQRPNCWPTRTAGHQLHSHPDMVRTALKFQEVLGGRLTVKNTFIHFEAESTACAMNRSHSCHL